MGWLDGVFGWHDAFGHLSYVLIAVSYYLTRMLWLRILAVIGLAFEILYFHFSGGELNAGIAWNVTFIAINLYQLWRLVEDGRSMRRAPDRALLRSCTRATFDDAQLGRLLRKGAWRDLAPGTVLTREGQTVRELSLLCGGHAVVHVGGTVVARLGPGDFIGEISFLSGDPACATVITDAPSRILAFDQEELRKLIARDEQVAAAIHCCVGRDLAGKLRRGGARASMGGYLARAS